MKTCGTCKIEKPISEFHKKSAAPDGLSYTCKQCASARTRRLYQENKEAKQKYAYDKRRGDREGIMLTQAKIRARSLSLPFNIEREDIIIPECCPVFPELTLTVGAGDASPSLDKLIPNLGYVKGNIYVISQRANRIKNDSTVQELQALLHWVTQQIDNDGVSQ